MAELYNIDGSYRGEAGQPDPDVIEHLEKLMERAQAGEIVGIAYAFEWIDGSIGSARAGEQSARLVGALECIKIALANAVNE